MNWPTRWSPTSMSVEMLALLAGRCVDVLGVGRGRPHARRAERGPESSGVVKRGHAGAGTVRAEAKEGPCLDCYRSGQPGRAARIWPHPPATGPFPRPRPSTPGSVRGPAGQCACAGSVTGVLSLFRVEAGEMQRAGLDAAQALADVATIAILQHRATVEAQVLKQQLHHALNGRTVIEHAKGVVAERRPNMSRPSPSCAGTPGTTTCASSALPKPLPPAPWPPPRWAGAGPVVTDIARHGGPAGPMAPSADGWPACSATRTGPGAERLGWGSARYRGELRPTNRAPCPFAS